MANKKIKKYNLDDTLIEWILSLAGNKNISYENLSESLKRMIRQGSGSGGSGSYDDTIIFEEVEKLKKDKVDKTAAANFFNKEEDVVNVENLTPEIQATLKLVKKLKQVDPETVRLKSEPINTDDLDPSLRNTIENVDQRITQAKRLIESAKEVIQKLQGVASDTSGITEVASSCTKLNNEIDKLKKENESIKDDLSRTSTKSNESHDKLMQLEEKIHNIPLLSTDGTLSESQIPISIPRMSDINEIRKLLKNIKVTDVSSSDPSMMNMKEFNIAANSSTSIPVGEINFKTYKIFIKDSEQNSRSYGKYINPDGVITTSYDADHEIFIFYNDSSTDLEVVIVY